MTALGAEVIWTRLLSLLFGATVYTFSLILAVFLFGLGIGSSIGSAIAARIARPRLALGWCQMLLCAAMAWTAYMLTQSLPYWPINPSISTDPWFNFQLDLVRCLWAVLPGAILWGASFPLALASVASGGKDPARLVGGVYAANTLGAIVGSLTASLLLVVWLGSQHAQQVLDARLGDFGAAHARIGGRRSVREEITLPVRRHAAARGGDGERRAAGADDPAGARNSRRLRPLRGNTDRRAPRSSTSAKGWNASVAVSRLSNGVLELPQRRQGPGVERAAGHAPAADARPPDDARPAEPGVGPRHRLRRRRDRRRRLGRSGRQAPDDRRDRAAGPAGSSRNTSATTISTSSTTRRSHVVLDDARHFLLTTQEKFDAITSDPLDPWVKGAAMLYTREFFETAKAHLNPGGAVTLFVQLYESNTAAVKSEIATFLEVFPDGVVWGNTNNGAGYDLVLLGQAEPTRIDVEAVQAKLTAPTMAPVAQSLREIGMYSAVDLFSNYAGMASDLAPWLADATINRDRNLRLQYLAGMGFNLYQSEAIYSDMLQYSRYPEGLFVGSEATKQALRAGIQRMQGK